MPMKRNTVEIEIRLSLPESVAREAEACGLRISYLVTGERQGCRIGESLPLPEIAERFPHVC